MKTFSKKVIIGLGLIAFISNSSFAKDSAEVLISKNGCMACHNVMGMKDAPPFAGIAWRNLRWSNNPKATIINSIKNGSHGKYPMFSNTKMPSFNNLSKEELNVLATWIISQSSNNMMRCGSGRCGMSGNNASIHNNIRQDSNQSWW